MERLRDRVALITGAARGQGEAQARRFAAEGARVVIGDVLDEEGRAVADDIGEAATFVRLDVTSEASWDSATRATLQRFGKLDALINNAGVLMFAPLLETSLLDYTNVITVNQTGVFLGMRAVAPHMARGSSIVNVSSIEGLMGMPGLVAYGASKFAVRGMTKVAALEFARNGIRVNSLHPGVVKSPMIDRPDVQAAISTLMESVPLGREANADEIAAVALFLISDESSYVTGAEFVVDGGMTCGKTFSMEQLA
jgi:3alpha(or 20beta)-hydroxysteroid dehydrogenase